MANQQNMISIAYLSNKFLFGKISLFKKVSDKKKFLKRFQAHEFFSTTHTATPPKAEQF
jgi:hypothetical protein